jgi:hypothetical protein
MTVAQLAAVAGLAVDDLVAVVLKPSKTSSTAKPAKTKPASAKPASAKPATGKAKRAAEYRAKVQALVLKSRKPMLSTEIRKRVGGTAVQCRHALSVLIAEGVVEHDGGSTRARRYMAA